jgi:thioredoxin reductase
MPRSDQPRLAVLGAGPIGLEAALYARTLGLPVTVYEQGRVGEHLHRWGHVRLFSPFGMNSTPLGRAAIRLQDARHTFPGDGDCTTGRDHLAAYLEPLAATEKLRDCLQLGAQVLHIGRRGCLKDDTPGDPQRGRQPLRLLVRTNDHRERIDEADVVLDCTGTYGRHRWLGDGGIPALGEAAAAQHLIYGLEDVGGQHRHHFLGRKILVVGTGYSAATTVCALADLARDNADTWVIWLGRGPSSSQPIRRHVGDPLPERDRLALRANTLATRAEGNVEFHPQSAVEALEWHGHDHGFRVSGRRGGRPYTWHVDRLIANVGSTPDTDLYRELQVHECYASLGPMNLASALLKHAGGDCLQVPAQGAATLRNPEPNFFILGAKSYGRNSNFLLRTGFEQVREVFTLITDKADLDLYKKR